MCGAMALCVPLVRCGFRYGAVSAKIMQCVYSSIAQCCRYGPVYSFLGSAMLSFWLGECRYSAVHTDMVHWFGWRCVCGLWPVSPVVVLCIPMWLYVPCSIWRWFACGIVWSGSGSVCLLWPCGSSYFAVGSYVSQCLPIWVIEFLCGAVDDYPPLSRIPLLLATPFQSGLEPPPGCHLISLVTRYCVQLCYCCSWLGIGTVGACLAP